MIDQYQAFTQSPIGKFVVKNLGLPSSVVLDRFEQGQPVIRGAVLVGAAPKGVLSSAIANVLSTIHADSYAGNNTDIQQAAAQVGLNLRAFNSGDKESRFKAVIFDASGIQNSEQLNELHKFSGFTFYYERTRNSRFSPSGSTLFLLYSLNNCGR